MSLEKKGYDLTMAEKIRNLKVIRNISYYKKEDEPVIKEEYELTLARKLKNLKVIRKLQLSSKFLRISVQSENNKTVVLLEGK